MSYTKTTNFAIKDTYLTGNPAKVIKGSEIDTEFNNIATVNATNVTGPASSADNQLALFSDLTGKALKAGGIVGTAATADVTTSATDTTAGRLWRTNDLVKQTSATDVTTGRMVTTDGFGLGKAVDLGPSVNLNTVLVSGFYRIQSAPTNAPSAGSNYSGMLVLRSDDTIWQQIVECSTGNAYVRAASGISSSPVWTAWVPIAGVGTNQTWQDVTGSRAVSTNYTNSTGKPIHVVISGNTFSTTGTARIIATGSVNVGDVSWSLASGNYPVTLSAVIPVGGTYFLSATMGIARWSELR